MGEVQRIYRSWRSVGTVVSVVGQAKGGKTTYRRFRSIGALGTVSAQSSTRPLVPNKVSKHSNPTVRIQRYHAVSNAIIQI